MSEIDDNELAASLPENDDAIRGARLSLEAAFGQVTLAMRSVARYRSQTLADLAHLVINPLRQDCVAFTAPQPENGQDGIVVTAIAIWASVSDEVDRKIKEQITAGVFPLRLAAEDWKSGDIVWLLDIIASDRDVATDLLKGFHTIAGTHAINIHPMAASLVDRDVLRGLSGDRPGEDAAEKLPENATLN